LAAATAALLALLDKDGTVGLSKILIICVPSTFIGCMLGALSVYVAVDVTDDLLVNDSAEAGTEDGSTWEDDSVEIFVFLDTDGLAHEFLRRGCL
jgi:anaerobic C4-dicarboxylate transporter